MVERHRKLLLVAYARTRQEADEFFGTADRVGDDDVWDRDRAWAPRLRRTYTNLPGLDPAALPAVPEITTAELHQAAVMAKDAATRAVRTDLMIAAIASARGRPLDTRNEADFKAWKICSRSLPSSVSVKCTLPAMCLAGQGGA